MQAISVLPYTLVVRTDLAYSCTDVAHLGSRRVSYLDRD